MPNLFELEELVSILQVPSFDTATAALVRELVTIEIRREAGPAVFDALTDLSEFKGIALAAAKRAVWNPEGLRSRSGQIDDYQESVTYASETLTDVELTDSEKARIAAIVGLAAGAFTIRPVATPFRPPVAYPYPYC